MYWRNRHIPQAVGAVTIVAILAAEVIFVAVAWPKGWESAAQASLAGVLISAAAATLSIVVKWAFDFMTLRTQHQLKIRERILEHSYLYACDYLMPLAGIAGEMAKYLSEYRTAGSDGDKAAKAVDGAFYSVALYTRLHSALVGTIPLPDCPRPLGVFLASKQGEDLVWDLMMPPWAFGIRSLEEESVVVRHVTGDNDSSSRLIPPAAFIQQARDPSHPLFRLRQQFAETIEGDSYLGEKIDVLLVLTEVINREVNSMLHAWYAQPEEPLPSGLTRVYSIDEDVKRDQLGIFYDPDGANDASVSRRV